MKGPEPIIIIKGIFMPQVKKKINAVAAEAKKKQDNPLKDCPVLLLMKKNYLLNKYLIYECAVVSFSLEHIVSWLQSFDVDL